MIDGVEVAIENPGGSIRHYGNAPHEQVTMLHPYGFFVGVPGMDGDELDVFVGPFNATERPVVTVRIKKKPDFTVDDEDKVFIGFEDVAHVQRVFAEHFDAPQFWTTGVLTVESWNEFKLRAIRPHVAKRIPTVPHLPAAQRRMLAGHLRNQGHVRIAEAQLKHTIHRFLRSEVHHVADQIAHHAHLAKAEQPTDKDVQDILDALDLDGWAVLVDPTAKVLSAVASAGAQSGLMEVKAYTAPNFERANTKAIDWAQDRAAELVGMRWDGDELVPNPNPEWAITDSTREMIRDDVRDAIAEGWSRKELADKLSESYAFSEERADMISRTEISRTLVMGNLEGWRNSGVVAGKRWIVGNDHDHDDECDDNALDDIIDIDADFSSGDDAPPAHPNCSCDILPVLADEMDEAE